MKTDDMPEPVRRGGLADDVCRRIADEIVLGNLPPGMRLDEVSLAARFNVSRTPVREALKQVVGAYAMAVIDKNEPDQIIAARKPLHAGGGIDRAAEKIKLLVEFDDETRARVNARF